MAGTLTTESLNGVPTRGNLGATALHPQSGVVQGAQTAASLKRTTGYMSDPVPFSFTNTVHDPSNMNQSL